MKKFLMMALVGWAVADAAAETWKGSCEISFTVTETMNRKFSGTGSAEEFPVAVEPAGSAQAATWKVDVKPGKLSTKKEARDAEMYKMFRLAEFPVVTGEVKALDLNALKKQAGEAVEMPFHLTIIGVGQDLKAKVSNVKDEGGKLSFDADFTVDMKSFTLKPKVMMGIFRVHNEVPVHAAFTFAH